MTSHPDARSGSARGPWRLRFAGYAPPDSVYSQAARRFKLEVEALSGGLVVVDLFWNVLDFGYTAEQLIQLVDCGLLSGCYMSTAYLTELAPKLALFDLPFLIESRSQAFRLLDGAAGAEMAAQLESSSGLKHLGYWENGFRHLTNARHPVRSAADLAGLRIRLQPNPLHQRGFALMGAVPVLTDVADLVNALRDGRADGQENPLDNTWTYGVYRYTPYVTLSGHFYGVRGLYANRAWFESLPADLRHAVQLAADRATAEQRRRAEAREDEIRRLLEAEGLEIVELAPGTRAELRARLAPLYAEAAELVGVTLLAELDAKGTGA